MVADPLRERGRRSGPRRALADRGTGVWLSWFDLDGLAQAWASRLLELGLRPGDRVAVADPAGATFAGTFWGVLRAGGAVVPLNPRAPIPDRDRVIADARPRLLVEDGEVRPLEGAAPGPEGDACVVYTSGTTGAPRGVRLTLGNLVASALGCQQSLGSTDADRWLLCLSPHHIGGLALLVRSVVSNQPLVTLPRFEAGAVLAALRDEHPTLVSVVPTMLERLLTAAGPEPLRGLRAILVGGGPVPPGRVREWTAMGLAVCPTYGMTETCSQVCTVPPGRAAELAGTAGFPHQQAVIEIVEGEIVVSGPTVSPGYANPDLPGQPHQGRILTGDLGFLDRRGALVISGRRDDAVITGGENVMPEEVEAVLLAHPGVRDAAVVGRPDPTWGQVLEAVVVGEAEPAELEAWCRERLPGFKVPRRWRRAERLPRSEGGKLLRRDRFFSEGPSG